ncbi:hypothetical protein ASD51_14210 [Streptomyces sp. Root55]|nr:hypothetical protein ASD26_18680 [Streptomyces sp. Root1319]KQZ05538.1 hypothetical protein ASD51_14210 [Streptomyces sp. Root55]
MSGWSATEKRISLVLVGHARTASVLKAGYLDGVVDLHLPVGQVVPASEGEDRGRHRDTVRT